MPEIMILSQDTYKVSQKFNLWWTSNFYSLKKSENRQKPTGPDVIGFGR
jgi:hypothetical protein